MAEKPRAPLLPHISAHRLCASRDARQPASFRSPYQSEDRGCTGASIRTAMSSKMNATPRFSTRWIDSEQTAKDSVESRRDGRDERIGWPNTIVTSIEYRDNFVDMSTNAPFPVRLATASRSDDPRREVNEPWVRSVARGVCVRPAEAPRERGDATALT